MKENQPKRKRGKRKKAELNNKVKTAEALLLKNDLDESKTIAEVRELIGPDWGCAKKYIDYAKKAIFNNDKEALKAVIFEHLRDYNLIANECRTNKDYNTLMKARNAAEKLLHLHAPETFVQIFNSSTSVMDLGNVPDDVLRKFIEAEEGLQKHMNE